MILKLAQAQLFFATGMEMHELKVSASPKDAGVHTLLLAVVSTLNGPFLSQVAYTRSLYDEAVTWCV